MKKWKGKELPSGISYDPKQGLLRLDVRQPRGYRQICLGFFDTLENAEEGQKAYKRFTNKIKKLTWTY